MSREFKFRTWDEADGNHRDKDSMCYFNGHLPANDADVVMQYTGMRSEDGTEIYEGDVLRRIIIHGTVSYENLVVRFKNGQFRMFSRHGNPYSILGEKVLGNIYENPELLSS